MTEQMQDHIEKLVAVDRMLEIVSHTINAGCSASLTQNELRDARQALTLTTDLLRQDYDKMERARDAAIEFLTHLQDEGLDSIFTSNPSRRAIDRNITQTIALLQGGEDEAE